MTSAELPVETIAAQWAVCIDPLLGDKALSVDVSAARFANPAAFHVNNTAHAVVSFVLSGEGEESAHSEVDDLMRLFALRETAPSQALQCFFELRSLVQNHMAGVFSDDQQDAVGARAEACLLHAFDAYVASREKLAQIALRELKQRNAVLEQVQESSYEKIGEGVL